MCARECVSMCACLREIVYVCAWMWNGECVSESVCICITAIHSFVYIKWTEEHICSCHNITSQVFISRAHTLVVRMHPNVKSNAFVHVWTRIHTLAFKSSLYATCQHFMHSLRYDLSLLKGIFVRICLYMCIVSCLCVCEWMNAISTYVTVYRAVCMCAKARNWIWFQSTAILMKQKEHTINIEIFTFKFELSTVVNT